MAVVGTLVARSVRSDGPWSVAFRPAIAAIRRTGPTRTGAPVQDRRTTSEQARARKFSSHSAGMGWHQDRHRVYVATMIVATGPLSVGVLAVAWLPGDDAGTVAPRERCRSEFSGAATWPPSCSVLLHRKPTSTTRLERPGVTIALAYHQLLLRWLVILRLRPARRPAIFRSVTGWALVCRSLG
jgi:hypothetical protein